MACAQFSMDKVQVFRLNSYGHFFQRHGGELDTAQEIRPQSLKMEAHKATHFARRFLTSECGGNIALCQAPIFSENNPRTQPKTFSENEEKRQRQHVGDRRSGAIKKIDDKIEHAGSVAGERGRVNLPAPCFNQYNVPGATIAFPFSSS